MKDEQYNFQHTSIPSPLLPVALLLSSLLPLPPFFSQLASLFSPLCLIASAPPCNHAGSWLSFGVVYIAVIVRVQYRDWAEHVYSLTGQLCNKSGRGEESIGVWGERWGDSNNKVEEERQKMPKHLRKDIVLICQHHLCSYE